MQTFSYTKVFLQSAIRFLVSRRFRLLHIPSFSLLFSWSIPLNLQLPSFVRFFVTLPHFLSFPLFLLFVLIFLFLVRLFRLVVISDSDQGTFSSGGRASDGRGSLPIQ